MNARPEPRRNAIPSKVLAALGAGALAFLVSTPYVGAEQGDDIRALKQEVQTLEKGQAEMKKGIDEILKTLEPLKRRQEAMEFKPQEMSVADAPYIGKKNAPVTVVEFLDYQCPFCQKYHASIEPQISKDYVSTGKVKFAVRQLPLPTLHPAAVECAQAVLCAGDQGKYWEMASDVIENPKKVAPPDLSGYAKGLGLDTATFDKCLSSAKYRERVESEQAMGEKLGLSGTPSFVLGLTDSNDPSKLRATSVIRGAQPYAQFKQTIDELLAKQKKGS
jgi:protein-disulfide isomerase